MVRTTHLRDAACGVGEKLTSFFLSEYFRIHDTINDDGDHILASQTDDASGIGDNAIGCTMGSGQDLSSHAAEDTVDRTIHDRLL